ncbi:MULTISPECIES: hypothetical protein [Paraburkholderia]|jgi:hypothetical protein|uniref:Uncharacterized protein n=1 Tax=Paraburkholderia madseniana TaxID=2599607 RepID=A0A6N6W848_9BURK|nr:MULTISPECIES: hypothetical protein [Paraburkholderia]KAE8755944.1 hypothetical protein FSO04_31690 [Paraburkholderia madseniana]MCX4150860.1 hypothetical protein [Paraburkholderia madseniana]MCX4177672.1 hypothetical protein [Paraburkholderia madseniana]MDN7153793.1 hypothetical protein [Paraburkholderia sp. WS6]MDQ6412675.1 hypothetical protein [Paraburkholderia madseniana]
MASFTYTAWTNGSATQLLEKLKHLFDQRNFSMKNPQSGMCHVWNGEGECRQIDADSLQTIQEEKLPLGIQWWRGGEDIFVTLAANKSVGGTNCNVRLVALTREEEAEIAKLMILHIVPEKNVFPDDFPVFQLDAQ